MLFLNYPSIKNILLMEKIRSNHILYFKIQMSENKILHQKKTIMQQIRALRPPPNATPEQAIQALVHQAQYYTNFLLSRHQIHRKNAAIQQKKRGHFQQEDQEVQHIMEEQQDQQNYSFTRLNEQPSILQGGQLKYYQLVGLNWMISLYESGINGILADDMGLGKTIQTISIIAFIRQFKKINGPHIIIAPKITLGNWVNQFQKWLPSCKVVKLIATKEQRQQILAEQVNNGKFDVLITSFQGVRICLNSLKKIKWHYIVIDEAHKIKNEESQLSQVVRKLTTQCKLLLTGTPLQNNLHELWSLLNFLLPQIFNTSQMFDNWFSSNTPSNSEEKLPQEQIQKRNAHMIHQLHKILKPFMLRRTKLEVQKSLPPKKEIHIYVGLTDVQLKLYKKLLTDRSSSDDEKKFYLNLIMQLRKACNHPYLFPGIQQQGAPNLGEHLVDNAGKMIVLDRLLRKLFAEKGHRVLIFSQMTMVLDILQDYCNFRQFKYCRIDGSTDMDSRDQQIQQFMTQGTDKFIFLLSTRAGGLGINLTAADTVVIYDSDWNPQMDLQAMDRAHRIGQKNMVNVYRLITENTVQQKIIQRQIIKLKWDNLVIQQAKSGQKNKALTKEQMKQMLQFGASVIVKSNTGTISDEEIDVILARGESKTNQLNKLVQDNLKKYQKDISDLSMNSINIFDFMMQDQPRKKQDIQAMDEILAKQLQVDMRTRRKNNEKTVNYTIDSNTKAKKDPTKEKKVCVPQYQFFNNRDVLNQLLQKQEDYNNFKNIDKSYEPLNQEQEKLKNSLMQTGLKNWSKNDFLAFVNANEKYGRKKFKQIAESVGKSLEEIIKYSQIFWSRIDQLSQKDKILKQIQNGQQKMENRRHHKQLLQWKASQCYEIDFNPQVYTKFKSKLFSIEADRFLAQNLYKNGVTNMAQVKQKIRTQPMFRFDHYFRSRTESQLNKRMQSVYRLIQKQKDNMHLGLDNEMIKQAKKKQKKKKKNEAKQKNKKHEANNSDEDVMAEQQEEKSQLNSAINSSAKGKQKQPNLNDFVKKGTNSNVIDLQSDQKGPFY